VQADVPAQRIDVLPASLPATTTAEQDREAASMRLKTAVREPVTTAEEERKSAGQREINLIWENTQMKVALSVIWSSLAAALILSVFGKFLGTPDLQLAAVVFLFGVANLVTGFYFGRTNHQKSGGVGGDAAGPR
jgi:cobalamin synthase